MASVAANQARVRAQVTRHDASLHRRNAELRVDLPGPLSGALLDRLLLVVNQKAKPIEVTTEFTLYDQSGSPVGAVRQVDQNSFKKFLRFCGNLDQFFTHTYQVVELSGEVVLTLKRPAKFLKSRVIVRNAAGGEIGQIVQQNVFGKIRFELVAGGVRVGGLYGDNWRGWNFRIDDHEGIEVARITKTFEGVLRTMFTTADNYVLQIHRPVEDPLRPLLFAAALTVDVALKQNARGFGWGNMLSG